MNKQITVKHQPKYLRRGKVIKFWLGNETFSRRIFLLNDKYLPDKYEQKHEISGGN